MAMTDGRHHPLAAQHISRAAPGGSFAASGFTLVELLMSLAITGVVMAAIASVVMGVSTGWQSASADRQLGVTAHQFHARLSDLVESASGIGAWQGGSLDGSGNSAAMVLWFDHNRNGRVERPELGLLFHERTHGGRMVLAMVHPAHAWMDPLFPLNSATDMPLSHMVFFIQSSPRKPLVGWTAQTLLSSPDRTRVPGLTLTWQGESASYGRPRLEYTVALDRGGEQRTFTSSVTRRVNL